MRSSMDIGFLGGIGRFLLVGQLLARQVIRVGMSRGEELVGGLDIEMIAL